MIFPVESANILGATRGWCGVRLTACDACGAEFVPEVREVPVVMPDGAALTLTHFACPECGAVFPVLLADPEARMVQRREERRRKSATERSALAVGDGSEGLESELSASRGRSDERFDRLRARYRGDFHLGRPQGRGAGAWWRVSGIEDLWYRDHEART